MTLTGEDVEARVRARLASSRLDHVASVVATAEEIARRAEWSEAERDAVGRAAWFHDAVKDEGETGWRRRIREAGEEPDPWVVERAPILLHAHAAAVWAAEMGEPDSRVLLAVRHHPTGHPDWDSIGRLLFVADFCEPGREFADELGTARLRDRAASELAEVARAVLRLRLTWQIGQDRAIHPVSLATWNTWLSGDDA